MFRLLATTINILALVGLSILAKDKIIYYAHKYIPLSAAQNSQALPQPRDVEVAFSPNGGGTTTIVRALSQAKNSIFVGAYSFTSKAIAQALLQAKKRGVTIKIILDKSQLSAKYSSSRFFTNQGFNIRIDKKHAIYHNKVMIIDKHTVITGSFNFTQAAENKNAENVLILRHSPQLANSYLANWQTHWNHSDSITRAQ